MKVKNCNTRIDLEMFNDLNRAAAARVQKKLSRCSLRDMSMPKITNLARRCPSYKKLLEELTTLPEKKK